jgi:hypothetical protein
MRMIVFLQNDPGEHAYWRSICVKVSLHSSLLVREAIGVALTKEMWRIAANCQVTVLADSKVLNRSQNCRWNALQ